MYWPNLKFVAFPVPEIIGGTQKISAVPGYVHAHFSPKSVALPVPEIIAIEVLGGLGLRTCEPPNLGEEEAVGDRGWYRSKERW